MFKKDNNKTKRKNRKYSRWWFYLRARWRFTCEFSDWWFFWVLRLDDEIWWSLGVPRSDAEICSWSSAIRCRNLVKSWGIGKWGSQERPSLTANEVHTSSANEGRWISDRQVSIMLLKVNERFQCDCWEMKGFMTAEGNGWQRIQALQ